MSLPAKRLGVVGDKAAEHMGLLSENSDVWQMIRDFLITGEYRPAGPLERPARAMPPEPAAHRTLVVIRGRSYVRVTDQSGKENTRISGIAALAVPDVTIQYEDDSVSVDFSSGREMAIEAVAETEASGFLEIEIFRSESEEVILESKRYRLDPQGKPWRLAFSTDSLSKLSWDQNGNSSFETDEAVQPTHQGQGVEADMIAPQLQFSFARTNEQWKASLLATDNHDSAPKIYQSINESAFEPHAGNLPLAEDSPFKLRAFAEDTMGNISGLVETIVSLKLGLQRDGLATVTVSWPASQALMLETALKPEGPWTPFDGKATRAGDMFSASIAVPGPAVFFRLRFVPLIR